MHYVSYQHDFIYAVQAILILLLILLAFSVPCSLQPASAEAMHRLHASAATRFRREFRQTQNIAGMQRIYGIGHRAGFMCKLQRSQYFLVRKP